MKRFWHWWRYDFSLDHLFILLMMPAILGFVGNVLYVYVLYWLTSPFDAFTLTCCVMFFVGGFGLLFRRIG